MFIICLGLPVKSGLYRWTQDNTTNSCSLPDQQYDLILCADCLFFDEGRDQLVTRMSQLIKDGGKILGVTQFLHLKFFTTTKILKIEFE